MARNNRAVARPQIVDRLAHRIGDSLGALEFAGSIQHFDAMGEMRPNFQVS
jgi:hypothetical protein